MNAQLGKYELVGRLGAGTYGLVYRAFDPHLKREVAIKVCTATDESARLRFYREAEIAGNLVHANITTVHDFGFHGDLPFLVEELLEGETLDRRIRRRDPLSLSQQLDYLVQLVDGLGYAHRQGVVHRDVKPANVLVLPDDSIKILDFGTARRTAGESPLTQAGTTVGTAAYVAPEVLRGHAATAAADVFACGVLAYELLAGQRPFPGRQVAEVLSQILHDETRPLLDVWPECPPGVSVVVARCLAKDVAARFRHCDELGRELRAVAAATFTGPPPAGCRVAPHPPNATVARDWLATLVARARDALVTGEAVGALLVARTAAGLGLADAELAAVEQEARHLCSAAPVPSSPVPSQDADADVERARAELRAVLYVGDVAGVSDVVRRHAPALRDRELAASLRQQLLARLGGVVGALGAAADGVVAAGCRAAQRLLAGDRLPTCESVLRQVVEVERHPGEAAEMLHVVAASRRSVAGGTDVRLAEAAAGVRALLERRRPQQATAALSFALTRHGTRLPGLPGLLAAVARELRREVEGIRQRRSVVGAGLAALAPGSVLEPAGTVVALARDLGLPLPAAPTNATPAAALLGTARELAAAGDDAGALAALLQAAAAEPESPEVRRLLAECGHALRRPGRPGRGAVRRAHQRPVAVGPDHS